MVNLAKRASIVTLSILICLSLLICTGCSEKTSNVNPYKPQTSYRSVSESVIASNDNFTLLWDEERHCVLLSDNESEKVWSSIPYSYYQNSTEGDNPQVDLMLATPLIIQYFTENFSVQTAYAATKVVADQTFSAQKIEDGLQIVYFFESQEIAIPIRYLLTSEGLEVRVMIDGIREGANKLYKISLLPGMVSVKNTDDRSNYLFMPSGSGTLMYTDDSKRQPRVVEMDVFGRDITVTENDKLSNTEPCRLPVFAAKETDGGLIAVLGEGSDLAMLTANVGQSSLGYSNAYVTYTLRGTDLINTTDENGKQSVVSLHTDDLVKQKYTSVTYCPLKEDESDYVSMAKFYQSKILSDKNVVEKAMPLVLDFYGGIEVKSRILGVSYTEFLPLTTLSDVKNITKECYESTGVSPRILLTGYGKSGASYGPIAGGIKISNKLGGTKGYNSLMEYFTKNSLEAVFDVDMLLYDKNGCGINKSDASEKVSTLKAQFLSYDVATRKKSSAFETPYIVGRNALGYVTEKTINFLKKENIKSVNLGTIGSYSYSDYSSNTSYCKANMSKTVSKIFSIVSQNGIDIYTRNSNSYAANLSSGIFEVPTQSSRYDGMDVDVPFYEIVYKGYSEMSVSPLNLAVNMNNQFLKAVECGIGISFSICNNLDYRLATSQINALSRSDYEAQKENIEYYSKEIVKVTDAVGTSKIVDHYKENGCSVTEFENGAVIVTNFNKFDVETKYGNVSAGDYLLVMDGEVI